MLGSFVFYNLFSQLTAGLTLCTTAGRHAPEIRVSPQWHKLLRHVVLARPS